MNVIKVNFDNAYIKRPKKIEPSVQAYKYIKVESNFSYKVLRLTIYTNIEQEPFYTDFVFDVYINNVLVSRITKDSRKEGNAFIIEFTDRTLFTADSLAITIDGEYKNEQGYTYSVNSKYKIYNYPVCSDDIFCSEYTYVSDYINGSNIFGFYNEDDGKFYYDKNASMDNFGVITYTYSDQFHPELIDIDWNEKTFIDISNNKHYKWDSTQNQFILQLEEE